MDKTPPPPTQQQQQQPTINVNNDASNNNNTDDDIETDELDNICPTAASSSSSSALCVTQPDTHSLISTRSDSFEDNIIRPSSPSKVKYQEDIEEQLNQDGSKVRTIKTFKEITGECKKINAKEAVGTQVRERSEKKAPDGVSFLTDYKKETIVGEDGTKLVRTSQISRTKYSPSYRARSASSSLMMSAGAAAASFSTAQQQNRNTSHDNLTSSSFYSAASGALQGQNIQSSTVLFQPLVQRQQHQLQHRTPLFIPFYGQNHTRNQMSGKTVHYYYDSYNRDLANSRNLQHQTQNQSFIRSRTNNFSDSNSNKNRFSSSSSCGSFINLNERYSMPGLGTAGISSLSSSSSSYLSPIRHRHVSSSATIREIVPPTFSYELENLRVKKGGEALFQGTVNGSYPFEIKWFLNNTELKSWELENTFNNNNSKRYEISMRQDFSETFLTGLIDYIISLKIFNCSYNDIGTYTAFVKNEAGDASCSAVLVIQGIFNMNKNTNQKWQIICMFFCHFMKLA
jgi:hypothetical protein